MSNQVGIELCKMIGIDPNTVSSIKINVEPDKIATAEVTFLLLDNNKLSFETKLFEISEIQKQNAS